MTAAVADSGERAGELGQAGLDGRAAAGGGDKGERGKFLRPDAEMRLPIYLEADVQSYPAQRAAQKGIPLGEMVNGLLKREIQIVESIK